MENTRGFQTSLLNVWKHEALDAITLAKAKDLHFNCSNL